MNMLHFFSVQYVNIIADEPRYGGVVCKLDDVVPTRAEDAVVGQQCEQQ